MVDLSPEALTEGPLHQERGDDGAAAIATTPSIRDLEALGEDGEKKGTSLGPTRVDGAPV